MRTGIIAAFALFIVSGCASTPPARGYCEGEGFLLDANFAGGNIHSCTVTGNRTAEVLIRPEDGTSIIPSPWYAFRVSHRGEGPVTVSVRFEDGPARYWPKISTDRKHWMPALEADVKFAEDGQSLWVRVHNTAPSTWVSGQELVTSEYYEDWINELATGEVTGTDLLGVSARGRPIHMATTAPRPEVVFLIGRQHPPEVTGAFAMRSFVSTVLADTDLANAFRERYSLVIIPLINPDGVANGHWRHNVNGVDLNRDWGTFTQPETQSVARLLATIEEAGVRPALMLDFHSTTSSLFYTQMPDETSWPVDFATVWLDRSRERLPGFAFKHDARPRSGQANTKNFFFDRYGIPAITYEIGDEVDRDQIAIASPVFAEEMMRLMLEYSAEEQTVNRRKTAASD